MMIKQNILGKAFFFALFACVFVAGMPVHSLAQAPYHLLKSYPLDEDGGWDYLFFDKGSHRVFISCATHVDVFDVKAEKVVGEIDHTEGVHGIALAPEFNHGYTSNGKTNTVLMFNMTTLDTLKRIRVGQKPDAIIYEPFTKTIMVCNGESKSVSLLDAEVGNVLATIPLGGAPEYIVTDGEGHAFVNLEDRSELVGINLKTYLPYRRIKLTPGEGPTGLAIDVKNHRLFAGCRNQKMIIINYDNGKVIGSLPIGKGVDAVVFDPDKKVAVSSNGEGSLTVVGEVTPDSFAIVQTIPTQAGARTETIDPGTHNLYLVTADFGPAPEATKENPNPRPAIIANSVRLLKYGY